MEDETQLVGGNLVSLQHTNGDKYSSNKTERKGVKLERNVEEEKRGKVATDGGEIHYVVWLYVWE